MKIRKTQSFLKRQQHKKAAQKTFWNGIQKLKVPSKIKHFFWKSVSNSLPTKSNIVNRKILQAPMCHICSSTPENVVHAFQGCERIKHIWSQDFGWVDRIAAIDISFKDLVEKIRELSRPGQFGTIETSLDCEITRCHWTELLLLQKTVS